MAWPLAGFPSAGFPRAGAKDFPGDGLVNEVLAILRRPGVTAHIWAPGANGVSVASLPSNNYLLSDGSTGYSTVDGVVGLVLDAMGTVGAELVANGGFDTDTVWDKGASWSIAGGVAVCTGAANYLTQSFFQAADPVGTTYAVTVDVVAVSGTVYVGGGQYSYVPLALGTRTYYLTRSGLTNNIFLIGGGGGTCTLSSVSAKKITGIHLTQPTTANKPLVRRGMLNLITQSASPDNAAWTKLGTTTAPNSTTVNVPAVNDGIYDAVAVSAAAGSKWTSAFVLSGTGTTTIGVIRTAGGSYEEVLSAITLTATPTLYAVTLTLVGAQTALAPLIVRKTAQTATTVTFDGGGLFAGTWTAAQILAEGGIPTTTAAAASNPSAGKYWWNFGSAGVDDYMSAAFAPYQPTDDFVSIVGYRNQGSSAADYAFNVRGDGYKSAGGHYVALGKPGATWYDGTTTVSMESPTTIFTPIISTLAKRTNDRLFRINGAQVGATNTTALTPFTATHTYIGGSASGSAASPDTNYCLDGSISIVITASGSALTPADYPILERFAALFVPGIASF